QPAGERCQSAGAQACEIRLHGAGDENEHSCTGRDDSGNVETGRLPDARSRIHQRARCEDRDPCGAHPHWRRHYPWNPAHRADVTRPGARSISLPLWRAEDTRAHRLHPEDGQATKKLNSPRGWQIMKEAVVVSVVRTAVGKAPKGTLRYTRPDDLGAVAVKGAVDRVPGLDPKEIEDVIIGCATPEGEQGMNMARMISLRAGLPIEAAAMTVNRYCASGLQTIALAAERIRGGGAGVIVAGGAESMSYLP